MYLEKLAGLSADEKERRLQRVGQYCAQCVGFEAKYRCHILNKTRGDCALVLLKITFGTKVPIYAQTWARKAGRARA